MSEILEINKTFSFWTFSNCVIVCVIVRKCTTSRLSSIGIDPLDIVIIKSVNQSDTNEFLSEFTHIHIHIKFSFVCVCVCVSCLLLSLVILWCRCSWVWMWIDKGKWETTKYWPPQTQCSKKILSLLTIHFVDFRLKQRYRKESVWYNFVVKSNQNCTLQRTLFFHLSEKERNFEIVFHNEVEESM